MRAKGAIHVAMLGIAIILFGTLLRAQDVTIVINRGSSVSQITEAQLRDIFTGARSRFDDGGRAIPVLLKGGPAHEVFLHRHIRETPDEFRARWRKAVFTGQGFHAQRVCFRSGPAGIRRRNSWSDRLRQPVEKPGRSQGIGRLRPEVKARFLTASGDDVDDGSDQARDGELPGRDVNR